MKGKLVLFVALTTLLSACSGIDLNKPVLGGQAIVPTTTSVPPAAMPTVAQVQPTVAPTSAPTVASTNSAPKASQSWTFPNPPSPSELPKDLGSILIYQAPPGNCADKNDPNATCSTKKGQPTDGDFSLKSKTALVMTGDNILITQAGKLLAPRMNLASNHDLWVVVNTNGQAIALHMNAPNGSFRGYFTMGAGEEWSPQAVAYLRDVHLDHFLLPPQPRSFTPTPVANCESTNGCPNTNVRVVLWDGQKWSVAFGFYIIGETPFWRQGQSS